MPPIEAPSLPARLAARPGTNAWVRGYGVGLLCLWAFQTLGRLALFGTAETGSGFLPLLMHLSSAISITCLLALFFALLALVPWLSPVRALLAAFVGGTVHAFATIFDIYQLIFINLTGQPGPTRMIFEDPMLTLSLLDNAGINPSMVKLGLLGLVGLHCLLYLPVRRLLLSVPLKVARQRLPMGRVGIRGYVFLAIGALFTGLFFNMAPPAARLAMLEAFRPTWGIAPPQLLAAAKAPPQARTAGNGVAPRARPVILIIVDALRSDRMGIYNPRLRNTPFLSSLEAQGKLQKYEAYSTCTFSFCGIMSVFASRSWNDFGGGTETLIDRLGQHSYETHLVLAGEHKNFGGLTNLLGGPIASLTDQPARSQPDDRSAVAGLARLTFRDPAHSFLYMHLMSAHAGSFIQPAYRSTPGDTGKMGVYLFGSGGKAGYQQIYDLRVRQADNILRQIFALLQEKGVLNDALVVVTADHGQRTSEGGLLYHGGDADPPTLKIPLLIYDARAASYPLRAPVSQIDVAPSIAEAVGIAPSPAWKGEALQRRTDRVAVPVGTSQSTGMVFQSKGLPLLYLCNRRSGRKSLVDVRESPTRTQFELTPAIQKLHLQVAAPVREPGCR
jgi:glucan phosphoethanolaminetransferase (alkaline phosphatase superfamily)